ncbi:MAG: hemolysin family protein [Phycisphaerae bacterium]|jgi:CBS domain containing-hemolysin-like protein
MTFAAFLSSQAWNILVMLVLLGISGFLSGTETALFNLSPGQMFRMRTSGKSGRIVAALMAKPRQVLNTILLLNMCVNVGYAAITAMAVISLEDAGGSPWAVGAASIVPLLVLILFGEVSPKMFAFALGAPWAQAAAPILLVLQRGLSPLLWVVDRVIVYPATQMIAPGRPSNSDITSDELAAMLDISARKGVIERDVNVLLQEIVELTDLSAGDIMVPRVDMNAYDIDDGRAGLVELFKRSHLRKIPVYQKDIDHILGVIHAKRLLLEPSSPLRELVAKVPFVPEAANIERVLTQFRVTRTQMAIVVDEYGGTAGLVTLEDVLEEIVGDIPGPHEETVAPSVQRLSEREYLLDGELPIHEWADAFKMDLVSKRMSTIGGFVVSLLGAIPKVGDVVTYRNLRFTVISLRKRRIDKLHLELLEVQP